MIIVWRFHEAPAPLREGFRTDDVDWLALLPPREADSYIPWLECPAFGACNVETNLLEDGSLVVVGYHA